MASRITHGKDKVKDSFYWTIILTEKDARELPTDQWMKFTDAIKAIEEVMRENGQ